MFDGCIHLLLGCKFQFHRFGRLHRHAGKRIRLDIAAVACREGVVEYNQLFDSKLAQDGIVTLYHTLVLHQFQELADFGFRVHVGIFAGNLAADIYFQVASRNELLAGLVTSLYGSQDDVVLAADLHLRPEVGKRDQPVFGVGFDLICPGVKIHPLGTDRKF